MSTAHPHRLLPRAIPMPLRPIPVAPKAKSSAIAAELIVALGLLIGAPCAYFGAMTVRQSLPAGTHCYSNELSFCGNFPWHNKVVDPEPAYNGPCIALSTFYRFRGERYRLEFSQEKFLASESGNKALWCGAGLIVSLFLILAGGIKYESAR